MPTWPCHYSISLIIAGVSVVWFEMPLLLVSLHNGLAAGLLIGSVQLLHRLTPQSVDVAASLLAELAGCKKRTVGADKNYDTAGFVEECRSMNITPHVARNDNRPGGSAIDGRTSRHGGYQVSQRSRKRVEEPLGWGKTVGLIRQLKVRGLPKVNGVFMMTMIGWNLTRMRSLQG